MIDGCYKRRLMRSFLAWPIGQFLSDIHLLGFLYEERVSSESKEIKFYRCVLDATMVIFVFCNVFVVGGSHI